MQHARGQAHDHQIGAHAAHAESAFQQHSIRLDAALHIENVVSPSCNIDSDLLHASPFALMEVPLESQLLRQHCSRVFTQLDSKGQN